MSKDKNKVPTINQAYGEMYNEAIKIYNQLKQNEEDDLLSGYGHGKLLGRLIGLRQAMQIMEKLGIVKNHE